MKHIKRIGILVVVMFMSIMLVACGDKTNNNNGNGNGTGNGNGNGNGSVNEEVEYVKISTKEELIAYASDSENYTKNARLYADIDLGGDEWTPIASNIYDNYGDKCGGYSAIFDGNGHTISNYKISKMVNIDEGGVTVAIAGFFGCISNGTVKNLGLSDYKIEITESVNICYVGGLVCVGENLNIQNCYTTGDILLNISIEGNNISEYQGAVGCLVGGLVAYTGDVIIQNCYTTGDIDVSTLTTISNLQKMQCISGLIALPESDSIIQNSYVSGDINSKEVINTTSNLYLNTVVGGILSDSVENSYMSGNVNVSIESNKNIWSMSIVSVAGICGASIKNSYLSGNVSADVKLNGGETPNCEIYCGDIAFPGEDDLVSSNCYKSNESVIDLNVEINETLIDSEIIENATRADMQTIWTFASNNFDSKVWNLFTDKNPTLKDSKEISNVIEINSKDDLLKLKGKDIILKEIKLNLDIDLNKVEWEPMSLVGSTFDGNNHKISNFKITTGRKYNGFISEAKRSTIKNLKIEDFTFDFENDFSYVGGLVASGSDLIIENCHTDGEITITINNGCYVGGFIGDDNRSTINSCYSNVNIKRMGNSVSDYTSAGGFIGESSSKLINNCYSTGNVVVTSGSSGENTCYYGGFIGDLTGTIFNCYSTGYVVVSDNLNKNYTGGFIGELSGSIYNCYATGDVTILSNSTSNYIGGFAGYSYSNLINCYRYKGQVLTKPENIQVCESGINADMQIILNFVLECFDNNIWNLFEDKNPTLKDKIVVSNIIEINNKEDLLKLKGKLLNSKTIKLNVDIDLSEAEWKPIFLFNSTFDGNNHKISNFKITTGNNYNGFIGQAKNSTIKNLGLDKITINYKYDKDSYIGILVGNGSDLIVENCYAIGNITMSSDCDSYYSVYIGGLIGYVSSGKIRNSYSTVNIEVEYSVMKIHIGGLIGYAYSYLLIEKCYATGDITMSSGSNSYYSVYVGGLIGGGTYSYDIIIKDCYATGNITMSSDSGNIYAGGLIGYSNHDEVENCYATGNISITISSYISVNAGGLIGYLSPSSLIKNCYATGNISITDALFNSHKIGGLIGYKYQSSYSGSDNDEEVDKITNCYRYNGQSLTVSNKDNKYVVVCEDGTSTDMQTIWAFVSENFDSEVWNLYTDKNPTLK